MTNALRGRSMSTRRRLGAGCAVLAVVLAGAALASAEEPTVRKIDVFVRNADLFAGSPALVTGDSVSLPLEFLEKHLGFTRKQLPSDRIGVCRGDLCIPFGIGIGADDAREVDGRTFVPVSRLGKAFQGASVWDDAEGLVLIDFARRSDSPFRADGPIDFELPDLSGRLVKISAFRGRKVILFAWASW